MSTTSIIGIPAEVYIYGSGYMYAALGCGLGAIFALVFFLPLYEKLKIISIYQVKDFIVVLYVSTSSFLKK